MKKFLNNTKKFILIKQEGIFSSALILAGMTVASRISGFLRYRVMNSYFTKGDMDIFFASFKIPDLVFEILITGALTSSLIPIFIKYQKNKSELSDNISSIINIISVSLLFFISILLIFLDKITILITRGFSVEKINLIIYYSRILLVGQLPFLVLGNILTGIGQANKRFLITAIPPIIYNFVIIIVTIFLAGNFYLLAPIVGVLFGAFLFLVIQLPLLKNGEFIYKPVIKYTQGIREFFRIMVPRVITVVVAQIDATIDLTLTSLIGTGAYTIFYYGQHLQLLPISIIGIAFGQASLPYLSEIIEEKKTEEFKKIIVESILNLFFLIIPFMSFFIIARTPLVRLFFGGQKFDWDATVQTAFTLSYFSLSLPFHAIYYFLTRCYYALLDNKTPFIIGFLGILVNTGLSLFFILFLKLPVWSLAISFSISITLNVLILLIILSIKLKGLDFKFLISESAKMMITTVIPSVFVYFLMKLLDGLVFDTTRTINVFFLLLTGGIIYILIYLFLAWLLEVNEFYMLSKLVLKAKEYRRKIIEMYTTYE